jgi:hypothetical protein
MTEIASGAPFAPRPPSMACRPEKIAPDTWLIHHVQPALGAPLNLRIQSIGMTTIASAYSPVVPRSQVGRAFDMVCALPTTPPPPLPDQTMLDQLLAAMNG